MIFTDEEMSCLADLQTEIKGNTDKPKIYVVVTYKEFEFNEQGDRKCIYFDPESAITLHSLEEIKIFVKNNQRWSFERYLSEQGLSHSFAWDDTDDPIVEKYFEVFIEKKLHFGKMFSHDVETFFTRKKAEAYLEEHRNILHEKAHVVERLVSIESETGQLLKMLYRIASEAA
ncbi:hypothetical protein [Paenibacillus polymyxa]|uniref:Uncharacterized protein n=1 Tax=Paenibacillus polymyxa (strain SC2) TaxID=886882 RepID=E3EK38_PAEPS|nr:hypothetical protein [Paenibacillus polymyxa]ADO59747.1 hypothetical protein PPSC2_26445 [Paenibacillus polymyxa SC2]